MEKLEIYCDGGARGNPGPAASAFVIYKNGEVAHKEGRFLGTATNNVAEYMAVLFALEWLVEDGGYKEHEIQFFLDSELVAKQLMGLFKIKNEKLRNLAIRVKNLEKEFSGKVFYKNLPREKNVLADALVNKTLDSVT